MPVPFRRPGERLLWDERREMLRRAHERKSGIHIEEVPVTITIKHKRVIKRHCSFCMSAKMNTQGHLFCDGVLHSEGVYLPLNRFSLYPAEIDRPPRKRYANCRDCFLEKKFKTKTGMHGYIPVREISRYIDILIARHGVMDTTKRIGLTKDGLYYIRKEAINVRKITASKIMQAIIESNDELRPKQMAA